MVCDASDTASFATWLSFGKLFGVATLVGFGEKRCRKKIPLWAASDSDSDVRAVLRPTANTLDSFVDSLDPSTDYRLCDVRLDIPDPETAVFRARLFGPADSHVWARAWISNESVGTLAEAASPPMTSGDEVTLTVKLRNGGQPELACIRIEAAPLDTKHVMHILLD